MDRHHVSEVFGREAQPQEVPVEQPQYVASALKIVSIFAPETPYGFRTRRP